MARKAGLEWKAVGASLTDVATACRALPSKAPGAFAYANSGVMQQAGVVFLSRYITDGNHAKGSGTSRQQYTEPSGGTHGPVRKSNRDSSGNFLRNARGQFIYAARETKLFIKGKFVSRTGEMRATAIELARTPPTESVNVILAFGVNPKGRDGGTITAGVDSRGRAYLEITGGYKAAEVGVRGGFPVGVKGWWRSLRSVQGRWGTLLKKKFPDLLRPTIGGGP